MSSSEYRSDLIKINATKYWEIINTICSQKAEGIWFQMSRDQMDEEWLGLRTVVLTLSIDEIETIEHNQKLFKIIDKTKYAWAKILYDI